MSLKVVVLGTTSATAIVFYGNQFDVDKINVRSGTVLGPKPQSVYSGRHARNPFGMGFPYIPTDVSLAREFLIDQLGSVPDET